MRTYTSDYKNNIKLLGKQIDSVITYTYNGETIELGNEELNSVSPHYEGSILKSVMKQLDIDSNVEMPIGTVFNYRFGIKVRDEEVEDYRDNYDYINFGNFVVKEIEKQEDMKSYKITCYDKILYSMVDYEDLGITYPITIRNYISAICSKLGLNFANINDTFANYDKSIPAELYLDSEGNSLDYTFRDVLDELAQVTASTICINNNDQLEVRYITNTEDTINEEYLKDINVNFGEKYGPINSIVLSRSAESDNVYLTDDESVAENGLCEIKIIDNQIMNGNNRSQYLADILYKLDGLEYYLNDFSSPGITYYDLCDKYTIQIGDSYYSCVMFNDEINVTQGLEENVFTELPEESETDYTKADKTDRKINQTYLIVDKQNQAIEGVVSQVDEQNEQIAQIRLDYQELLSRISDIADITTSGESSYASVNLVDVNASQPIDVKIKPIGDSISYLYPNNGLYPSNTTYLKSRILRFENTDTNETFDWLLPTNLWYLNSTTYDELELSYGDGTNSTVVVTRRCQVDSNGVVSALTTPTTETYDYPSSLLLTDGDYTVTLLGYTNGYLYVQLMAKNIYTTQFYTKAETNSLIDQTASSIDLSVNQKLSNYSTTDEMNSAITIKANEINSVVSTKVGNNEVVSKINQSAEQITINANKINIDGVITAINDNTTTTIDGDKITTGSITASQVDSSVITTDNLSAQTISGNQITGGTITGTTISGNTITGGTISGSAIRSGDIKIGSRETTIASNGDVSIYPDAGGVFRFAQGGVRLNASYGVAITSNGGSNIYAGDNNIDIKACYDATAYVGCMSGNGSGERSAMGVRYDQLYLRSNYGSIYANGVAIGGSSSINTKENIKDLTEDKKQELYTLLKNIPLKEYDYKEQYGKKDNYGFLIEDIENTKLKDLLHIVQNEVNPDIKVYSSEDLTRLELVVIQELMKKIEILENKIAILERESDK